MLALAKILITSAPSAFHFRTSSRSILRHADDLVQSRRLTLEPSEMFSDRILTPEKPSRERLVDHRHMQ
jgi:hypothetical protein